MSLTNETINNTKITWPGGLSCSKMRYESLCLLYNQSRQDTFGDHMAFVVSCSKGTNSQDRIGCLQKLEVTASPNFTSAKMSVTHEVLPGLGDCSQITPVNETLKVAGFDSGAIVPISNFGPKKTFNCDVRGRLTHHCAPVNRIACCSMGRQLASGSLEGEVALFHVREDEIAFVSKASICNSPVSGLAYFKPTEDVPYRPQDASILNGENLLIYATMQGYLGAIDTRCKLGAEILCMPVPMSEPRMNITALSVFNNLPGHRLFIGTAGGQLVSIDLRLPQRRLIEQQLPGDSCIRRIKEVKVSSGNHPVGTFVAYTNGSNRIQILDTETMQPDSRWTCDRHPEGKQRDIYQVGERLITCGDEASIGCWMWNG